MESRLTLPRDYDEGDVDVLGGADMTILIDALKARNEKDSAAARIAPDGSALQRHHAARLKAGRALAEKLQRMAEADGKGGLREYTACVIKPVFGGTERVTVTSVSEDGAIKLLKRKGYDQVVWVM